MAYQNEFDKTGKSMKDGERAENNFIRLFEKRFGIKPVKATEYQNKHDHIDYFMQVKGHKASVDVKSWKGEKNLVPVEFISYGKLGWLYGKADYIAFETPDEKSFMMVKRQDLVCLVKRLCVVYFTNDRNEQLYRLYIRFKEKDGKKYYDCYTKIQRDDLLNIKYWYL